MKLDEIMKLLHIMIDEICVDYEYKKILYVYH